MLGTLMTAWQQPNLTITRCQISSAPRTEAPSSDFVERARVLMKRGYTPKIAVDIVLHEMEFEHRKNPAALAKARVDADAFLERIRKGLI